MKNFNQMISLFSAALLGAQVVSATALADPTLQSNFAIADRDIFSALFQILKASKDSNVKSTTAKTESDFTLSSPLGGNQLTCSGLESSVSGCQIKWQLPINNGTPAAAAAFKTASADQQTFKAALFEIMLAASQDPDLAKLIEVKGQSTGNMTLTLRQGGSFDNVTCQQMVAGQGLFGVLPGTLLKTCSFQLTENTTADNAGGFFKEAQSLSNPEALAMMPKTFIPGTKMIVGKIITGLTGKTDDADPAKIGLGLHSPSYAMTVTRNDHQIHGATARLIVTYASYNEQTKVRLDLDLEITGTVDAATGSKLETLTSIKVNAPTTSIAAGG